jgi:glutamyl-tRNA(Gln) amidotransferase subunit E
VIACLERPNMLSSESLTPGLSNADWDTIRASLGAGPSDAQVVFWAPEEDIATALIVLEERGQLAFAGVPNETRKSLPDGTTIFERVLPGPDRMYPDTDSAPLPIADEDIAVIRAGLAPEASDYIAQLAAWQIPGHLYEYLLARNRVPLMKELVDNFDLSPALVARLLAQVLKSLEGRFPGWPYLPEDSLKSLIASVQEKKLTPDIIEILVPVWYYQPDAALDRLLDLIGYRKIVTEEIIARIPQLRHEFVRLSNRTAPDAEFHWLMGQLRPLALGNLPLKELAGLVSREVTR